MSKPVYLLRFKSGQKMSGFIYVVDNESKNYDFIVKTNINNQNEWSDIGVTNVRRFREGGTTSIHLESNTGNFAKIHIPIRQEEVAYIETESGKQLYLDVLNPQVFDYKDISGIPIPTVPFIPIQQETNYDFNDLVKAINDLTKIYNVTTKSDIFEHTMMRLSGVSFPFDGYYKFDQSQKTPEYFFMDLGLSDTKVIEFARSLNEKYGQGTAEYMPSFNQGYSCAVRLKLSIVIEKILPVDFKENLEKTFSDEKMIQVYQKPYNELTKDLQNYVKQNTPKSITNGESITSLLNKLNFVTQLQVENQNKINHSITQKEDLNKGSDSNKDADNTSSHLKL